MRVFLSYASAQRPLAERINHALQSEGHMVFFDREDLPPGETYGDRIRDAVDRCHVFVFLVTPHSVSAGSYALTELIFAERVPRSRAPAVVPVLAAPLTDMAQLPPFIAPLTLLEPRGDAVAEVVARVAAIGRHRARRRWLQGAAASGAAGFVAAGGWFALRKSAPPPVVVGPAEKPRVVAEADRVRLVGMPGNDGWLVSLDIADQQVREIFVALADGQPFVSTGFQLHRHPATGLPLPQLQLLLPGALGEARHISVKYTDGDAHQRGPYRVLFDPKAQYLRFARSVLGMAPWLTFNTSPRGTVLVYFTTLLSYRNALREIRYSVDDTSLSRVMPVGADWSGRSAPGVGADERLYVEVPAATQFVAVKLSFIDGSESELKRYPVSEAGLRAGRTSTK